MLRLKEIRKNNNITQQQLSSILGVTQATLSGWENEKFEIDNNSLLKCAEYFNVSVDYILGKNTDISNGKGVKIPVLGNIQAGIPVEAVEEILDYEEISKEMAEQGEFFALKIRGESMLPRMVEGDIIIVRQQSDVDSGDVAVVFVNGNDATVKKIRKTATGIELIPLNPSFDITYYSKEEIEKLPVTIIGKVVELRGKF